MQSGRSDVLTHLADNLRRLRQQAGLSQQQLAQSSGISRRTIINVEAGEANISLAGLDRLAEALEATFIDLVAAPHAPATALEVTAWRGRAPESQARLLGAVPAHSEAQLWWWTLAAGETYEAEPDPEGWHEMVIVTAGRLLITREDAVSDLTIGQHAIYSSTQQYSYRNLHDGPTQFVRNVIT